MITFAETATEPQRAPEPAPGGGKIPAREAASGAAPGVDPNPDPEPTSNGPEPTPHGAPPTPATWEEAERLGEAIAELAAHLHAAEWRLLMMLHAFDAAECLGWGFRSTAHWLSWRTGIGMNAARERVRVARVLPTLPRISEGLRTGRLSFSKVRALSRVATPANEQDLLEFALHGTASHVERLVRAWRHVDRNEAAIRQDAARYERRELTLFVAADGSWHLEGRLEPEVGEVLKIALEAAARELYPDRTAREDTTAGQRRADAMGLVAECALRGGMAPEEPEEEAVDDGEAWEENIEVQEEDVGAQAEAVEASAENIEAQEEAVGAQVEDLGASENSGRAVESTSVESTPEESTKAARPKKHGCARRADRYQVVLHVDEGALAEGASVGAAVLAGSGIGVSPETARRLSCDASKVVMTHGPDGSVLDVGRRSRTASTSLRRALDARDGGCRFPGCLCKHTTPHHIRHWADGGETSLENLVLLCGFHHRALHEGGWRMEVAEDGGAGEPREVRFLGPDGRPLPHSPALPPAPPDPVEALQRKGAADGLELDGWTPTPRWNGERLDLHRAIHALWRPRATEGTSRA